MIKVFEQEAVFKSDVFGEKGISLFLGAGFSLNSSDFNGKRLPTGADLLDELKEAFSTTCSKHTKLTTAATVLEKSLSVGDFKDFLTKRFQVDSFDDLYSNLLEINIKNIFTTNIDDLPYKIWGKDNPKNMRYYIYDVLNKKGAKYDKDAIMYYPLHGSVKRGDGEYLFSMHSIIGAKSYQELKNVNDDEAILFWGWNFEDPDVVKDILHTDMNKNTHRWAIIYDNSQEDTIDWLKAEGFNIIETDTNGMLNYIKDIVDQHKLKAVVSQNRKDENESLKEYEITENIKIPLERVFTTCYSDWENVKNGFLPRMHFFREAEEAVAQNNNVIVYGMACSGKTTLMRQLFFSYDTPYYKHFLEAPCLEEVELYVKRLASKKALLFVDDCLADTEAFCYLCNNKNIQVIGFTRDVNFERQQDKISHISKTEININSLNDNDIIAIYNAIPVSIRTDNINKNTKKDKTLISILFSFIKNPFDFKFIYRLYKKDPDVAKAFVLICYCHANNAPASLDMIYSFFQKKDYKYILNIIDQLGKLKTEYNPNEILMSLYGNQDYYKARSAFLASKIISSLKGSNLLGEVLMTFAENIPAYKICNYSRFKRTAYDAKIIKDAFLKKENGTFTDEGRGEKFYNLCAYYDKSEYLFQQAALYFADEHIADYDKAYDWITNARKIDRMDRNTIKMTEAIVRFKANSLEEKKQSDRITNELIDSLNTMERACIEDKRGHIHYVDYSFYAIKFWKMNLNNRVALDHLKKSREFLLNPENQKNWKAFKTKKRIHQNLNEINEILKTANV